MMSGLVLDSISLSLETATPEPRIDGGFWENNCVSVVCLSVLFCLDFFTLVFVCVLVCVPRVGPVPSEFRRGRRTPWNWS